MTIGFLISCIVSAPLFAKQSCSEMRIDDMKFDNSREQPYTNFMRWQSMTENVQHFGD